jgi:predicted secreted protein
MTTNADIGHSSTFGIYNGVTYDNVAEVTSITPAGWTQDAIDATHMDSTDGYREFIPGLKDATEVQISINYVPSASDAILAAFASATLKTYRITHPNSVTLTFTAIVTSYQPEVPLDDKMTATATFKISGKPTWA